MLRFYSKQRISQIVRGKLFFILLIFFSLNSVHSETTSSSPAVTTNVSSSPSDKMPLPIFELPVPENASEKNYLGITGSGKCKVTEIKSRVLIIEVFTMYCPHCQHSAPFVNELFQTIQNRPDLKQKIKIIGIGVMNSAYEVNVFKNKYNISFPLFPDSHGTISKMLGVTGVPTFIGATINNDDSAERFFFQTGEVSDPTKFLSEILTLSKLKPEDTP